MSEQTAGGFYSHQPTLMQRFWRAAGFRYRLGAEPTEIDSLPGWIRSDISIQFAWSDRIRLLFTGRLRVASIVYMDISPTVTKSRADWIISAPGEARR